MGPEDPSIPAGPCREAHREGAQQLPAPQHTWGGPAPRKGGAEPGQHLQHHYLGAPQARGAATPLQALWSLKCRVGDKKLQLGLNPCMAGAKPAVLSRDPLQEARKGFLPPSQPLCRFWGGLRPQPCWRGCPELGDPWATQSPPPEPHKLSQGHEVCSYLRALGAGQARRTHLSLGREQGRDGVRAAAGKPQITEQGARGTHLGAVDSLAPDGARLARLSLRGE